MITLIGASSSNDRTPPVCHHQELKNQNMNTIKRKSLRLLGRTKSLDLKALGRELTLDPYKVDLTEKKIGDEGLKQLGSFTL